MEQERNSYLIPASIIVAGLLVAFAVFYSKSGKSVPLAEKSGSGEAARSGGRPSGQAQNIRPVTSEDHILGNPQAPVKIVEFSDLECPFCKSFHPTMKRVMEEFGKDGKVAWVYRHFPLDSIHPKARKEAEASECASELGGNEKFWAYVDRLFEVTPSNNNLDPAKLPEIAQDVGLGRGRFEECLSSGRHAERVAKDLEDAINSGGNGTPYSVLINAKGDPVPISGALPYAQIKSIVEQSL